MLKASVFGRGPQVMGRPSSLEAGHSGTRSPLQPMRGSAFVNTHSHNRPPLREIDAVPVEHSACDASSADVPPQLAGTAVFPESPSCGWSGDPPPESWQAPESKP